MGILDIQDSYVGAIQNQIAAEGRMSKLHEQPLVSEIEQDSGDKKIIYREEL